MVSPDEGSIKRAIGHAKRLGGKLAIVDKRRASAVSTEQENIIGGPVDGKVALVFDDMITTAGSICGAAQHRPGVGRKPGPRGGDARRLLRRRDRRNLAEAPISKASSISDSRFRSPKNKCSPKCRSSP